MVWLWYEFGLGVSWFYLDKFFMFGSIMVYVNSCVNLIFYVGMNDEFRKGFVRIFKCYCKYRGFY